MLDYLQSTGAHVVISLAVLVILLLIGAYVVLRFRNRSDDDTPTADELLTNFRELHDQGTLSAVEYRKLKSVLGKQIQETRKDDGDAG